MYEIFILLEQKNTLKIIPAGFPSVFRPNNMFIVITILICGVLALYWHKTTAFNYWKVRGVKHDDPLPFFGNNIRQFFRQASYTMLANEIYDKYPEEKVVGFYRASKPELVIRDPEIARRILLTDFNSFASRGLHPHRKVLEPLMRNLFFGDGDLWRLLRQRITPLFSTSKLKGMFHLVIRQAENLQALTEKLTEQDFYNAQELMARYTTDVIGECGFGLNMETLCDDESQFRKLGKRIFHRNLRDNIVLIVKFVFPELAKNLTFFAPELQETIVNLVKTVIKGRDFKPSGRNDFIDLMLEIREKGNIIGESLDKKNPDGSAKTVEIELDDTLLATQVFTFFAAGFETTSIVSSYTLHQLAFNPDCQVKVQNEIDKVLAKYNNKLTYDAIKEMKYLEMAFYEGNRMYPSLGYLIRMCTVPEYTFPELNLSITEGVVTLIPIQAFHNDENYFSNPDMFIPERWCDGIKKDVNSGIYLPFGDGPRSCIGVRLGLMQAMAGIASVLQKYTVEPAACSKRKPDPCPKGIITEGFAGGLPLKFKRRVRQQQ